MIKVKTFDYDRDHLYMEDNINNSLEQWQEEKHPKILNVASRTQENRTEIIITYEEQPCKTHRFHTDDNWCFTHNQYAEKCTEGQVCRMERR